MLKNEEISKDLEKRFKDFNTVEFPKYRGQTDETLKSLKNSSIALCSIENLIKTLENDLNKNTKVAETIQKCKESLDRGKSIEVPSVYFSDLLNEFEQKTSDYSHKIEELEQILKSPETDQANDIDHLYDVISLLYQNFL